MNKDDLLARCPRCNEPLQLDQGGCATCWPCDEAYRKKYDYMIAVEKFVDEVMMKLPDYEIIILKEGSWDKIRLLEETQA